MYQPLNNSTLTNWRTLMFKTIKNFLFGKPAKSQVPYAPFPLVEKTVVAKPVPTPEPVAEPVAVAEPVVTQKKKETVKKATTRPAKISSAKPDAVKKAPGKKPVAKKTNKPKKSST